MFKCRIKGSFTAVHIVGVRWVSLIPRRHQWHIVMSSDSIQIPFIHQLLVIKAQKMYKVYTRWRVTKCSSILSSPWVFFVTRWTCPYMQMIGRKKLCVGNLTSMQSPHLNYIFLCDNQKSPSPGKRLSFSLSLPLYPSSHPIIKSSLKIKPLSAGPWKSMKWSSHKKCW